MIIIITIILILIIIIIIVIIIIIMTIIMIITNQQTKKTFLIQTCDIINNAIVSWKVGTATKLTINPTLFQL